MKRLHAALAALVLVTLVPLSAPAAEWPPKPVKIIVPYAAGGAGDLLARVFGERLSEARGQQFVVENRTGGGGLIAAEAAARSEPDGYTLMESGMPSHVVAPAMNAKNASFDPVRDFTHIAYLGGPPNMFVVHSSSPVKSFKEVIDLMRTEPNAVGYVSPNIGSGRHMVTRNRAPQEKREAVSVA